MKTNLESSVGTWDFSHTALAQYNERDALDELMASLPAVEVSGRNPLAKLPARGPERVVLSDEVGFGPKGYRDAITTLLSNDASKDEGEYVCTFAVVSSNRCHQPTGPEETKGYVIQLSHGMDYQDLLVLPKNRALAEALHHTAVSGLLSGQTIPQVEQMVRTLAAKLGVAVEN